MNKTLHISRLADKDIKKIVDLLRSGKVGVLPTDTIYGLHGLALDQQVVNRIYDLKDRDKRKPMIILISKMDQLKLFDITLSKESEKFLKQNWPNKLSVILNCKNPSFNYLHRGANTLAFRMPKNDLLQKIIDKTGPFVSTSVNPQSQKPAQTIVQAQKYFDNLDFYLDAGRIISSPSTVIAIKSNKIEIVRQGSYLLRKS